MKKLLLVLAVAFLFSSLFSTTFKMPKDRQCHEFVEIVTNDKEIDLSVVKDFYFDYMSTMKRYDQDKILISEEANKLVFDLIIPVKSGNTILYLKYNLKILFKMNKMKFVYTLSNFYALNTYPDKKEISKVLISFEKQRYDLIDFINPVKSEFDF